MADQILLRVDHKKNQQLLAEWLGQRYTIISAEDASALDEPFDLALLDGTALDRLWAPLHACKAAAEPVFLPVLFLTNRQDIGMVTRHLWRSIDDIILMPIEKVELVARVEALLRARALSLELQTANRELRHKLDELQQTQASLQWSNYRFERAAEVIHGVIYDWNVPQNTVELSKSLEDVLGINGRQIKPYQDWWNGHTHPEDIDHVRQEIRAALAEGGDYSLEYRVARPSGDYVFMWDRGTVIRDDNGQANRVIGFLLDITNRKDTEAALNRLVEQERILRREAEEANQIKMNFLAMISHELRTPLTSIRGFSSTMLADDVEWNPEDLREFAQVIDEESSRMQDLVEQLLDLSRLQAGTFAVTLQTLDLAAVFDSARLQLGTLAADHQLVIDLPANLPRVRADGQRIVQVLSNLVNNAVKFSPSGSRIEIAARRNKDSVQIDISDEGPGIPGHERDRIFEAFRQLDRSRKGAGLGLAICKGIVNAHGGHIWVQPERLRGAVISFTLPVAREK